MLTWVLQRLGWFWFKRYTQVEAIEALRDAMAEGEQPQLRYRWREADKRVRG